MLADGITIGHPGDVVGNGPGQVSLGADLGLLSVRRAYGNKEDLMIEVELIDVTACERVRDLFNRSRELQRDGAVQRVVYAEVPPKVEYSLTEFGRSLIPVLIAM